MVLVEGLASPVPESTDASERSTKPSAEPGEEGPEEVFF